ncbi:TPA: hypothetical protein ACH3X3_003385 [Trebouxia sp. C0006]
MNMYGRNISPQVASTSQATPVLHQCRRACRHRKQFGVRAAVAAPEPVLEEQKIPSPSDPVPPNLNKISRHITQPKSQGASQAMLYATGLTEEDMNKPQVGISSVWYEGNPCNMHLMDLAAEVKAGVQDAGMVAFRFNTIGVSDGISMGTEGMSFSLQSRDLIADSIETVMGGQWYDGNISLPGCDKNMPGVLIAMGRLNRPSIMVYGGSIKPGYSKDNEPLDIVSAFQSYGAYAAKLIDETQRFDITRNACPGAGACGGMYTANTMSSAIEAMGMSLPYSSSVPAEDPLKKLECRLAGRALLELLKHDIKPRDIMTKQAFENAITVVMALGGSTNAVLHLLAMAHSVDVPLSIDDFQTISDRTPFIADLKPSGKYVMEDIHKVGDPFFVRSCSHVVRGTDTVLNSRDSAGLERTEVISLQTGWGYPSCAEVPFGEGIASWRLPHCHRQNPSRKPSSPTRAQRRAERHCAPGEANQEQWPPPDFVRELGARRLRGKDHWQGGTSIQRTC